MRRLWHEAAARLEAQGSGHPAEGFARSLRREEDTPGEEMLAAPGTLTNHHLRDTLVEIEHLVRELAADAAAARGL